MNVIERHPTLTEEFFDTRSSSRTFTSISSFSRKDMEDNLAGHLSPIDMADDQSNTLLQSTTIDQLRDWTSNEESSDSMNNTFEVEEVKTWNSLEVPARTLHNSSVYQRRFSAPNLRVGPRIHHFQLGICRAIGCRGRITNFPMANASAVVVQSTSVTDGLRNILDADILASRA